MIELVDFNTVYTKEKPAGAEVKKTRRSRTAKKAADAPAAEGGAKAE